MKKSMMRWPLIAVCLLLITTFGISCLGLEPSPEEKHTRLEQRVESFLQARIQGDLGAMKNFFQEPQQARLGNTQYKDGQIVAIELAEDGKTAVCKVKNTIMAMGFAFENVPQNLKWVWEKKDWYLLSQEVAKNPFVKKNNEKYQKIEVK